MDCDLSAMNENVPEVEDKESRQEPPCSSRKEEDILMSSHEEEGGEVNSAREDELLSSPGGKSKAGPTGPAMNELSREARRKQQRKESRKRYRQRKRTKEKEEKRRQKEGQDLEVQVTQADAAAPSTSAGTSRAAVVVQGNPRRGRQDRRWSRWQAEPPPSLKQRGPRAREAERAAKKTPIVLKAQV